MLCGESSTNGETAMTKNVGGIDKIARIVLGLVLLALVFVGPQTPWGWVGIIPLATGLMGFCPLYPLVGLNTSGKRKSA